METIFGKIEKTENEIRVITENGHSLIVENLTEMVQEKYNNLARGWARKPRGKKLFGFTIKTDGTVLILM